MAGGSLLMLLDDLATILDDVAAMSKVAARKTAGVLGDDLALNAEQVSGVRAARELPVVWAVAKGSMLNKVILVPLALLISAWLPWLVTPLLIVGGAFLCFEGFEKVAHRFWPHGHGQGDAHAAAAAPVETDPARLEQDKIKGAIRTDFILSAEIVIIILGTVASQPMLTQVLVLSLLSVLMTVGVYGLVAAIVKMDDVGLYLAKQHAGALLGRVGDGLLVLAPYLMKFLSLAGTIAMFLVGGDILLHGWPALEHMLHPVFLGFDNAVLTFVGGLLMSLLTGLVLGGLVLLGVTLVKRVVGRPAAQG